MTAITSPRMALTRADFASELGVSERHTYVLARDPRFPKPRQLSAPGSSKPVLRWIRAEIEAWFCAQPVAEVAPEPAQLSARRFRDGKEIRVTQKLRSPLP